MYYHSLDCQPPSEPENGGYTCHPSPCRTLSQGTVIEYFCDEGYVMKGDYQYLTCTNGEWDTLSQVRCLLSPGESARPGQESGPLRLGHDDWHRALTICHTSEGLQHRAPDHLPHGRGDYNQIR